MNALMMMIQFYSSQFLTAITLITLILNILIFTLYLNCFHHFSSDPCYFPIYFTVIFLYHQRTP